MSKINLVLIDSDKDYVDKCTLFIRTSEIKEKLQCKAFTTMETALQFIQMSKDPYICLISTSFQPFPAPLIEHLGTCLFLSESESFNKINEGNPNLIYKYQPLQQLFAKVISHFVESKEGMHPSGQGSTRIVSVYSSLGNCGKTTVAINLARQLAFHDKKVFYISLESASSSSLLLHGSDNQQFSQLLYYMKSAPMQLGSKLEYLKSHDSLARLDYLSPLNSMVEAQEISREEIRLLMEAIVRTQSYDFVILDLEATIQPRIIEALVQSDDVIWIVLDDVQCLFKTKTFFKEIADHSKIHFIVNKYTGSLENDFLSYGISVSGFLPYIPSWKSIKIPEQLLSMSVFNDAVYDVFTDQMLKGGTKDGVRSAADVKAAGYRAIGSI